MTFEVSSEIHQPPRKILIFTDFNGFCWPFSRWVKHISLYCHIIHLEILYFIQKFLFVDSWRFEFQSPPFKLCNKWPSAWLYHFVNFLSATIQGKNIWEASTHVAHIIIHESCECNGCNGSENWICLFIRHVALSEWLK